jgi:RNA polymerase sigma factor (sigma-70 family)
MTVSALWTRHRPLAYGIARDYFLPGAERQDVEQEALVGLWIAAKEWDRAKGASFRTFARVVIERRLASLVRTATAEKNRVLTDSERDTAQLELFEAPDLERVVLARERLAELMADGPALVRQERRRQQWRESKQRARDRAAA